MLSSQKCNVTNHGFAHYDLRTLSAWRDFPNGSGNINPACVNNNYQ